MKFPRLGALHEVGVEVAPMLHHWKQEWVCLEDDTGWETLKLGLADFAWLPDLACRFMPEGQTCSAGWEIVARLSCAYHAGAQQCCPMHVTATITVAA